MFVTRLQLIHVLESDETVMEMVCVMMMIIVQMIQILLKIMYVKKALHVDLQHDRIVLVIHDIGHLFVL